MSEAIDLKPIKDSLKSAKDISILISENPDHDTVAAALSLYLSIKETYQNIHIACPTPMAVEHSRLVGLDKIKSKIGNKNLVVSFEYIKDSIEKVSYNVEGNKFNLVVQPKVGSKPLDPGSVSYSYSGMSTDVAFIFGAESFEDLEDLYQKNKKAFESAYTISINRTIDAPFAKSTISDQNSGSLSEIATWLIENLELNISPDIASNLLSGIDRATNKFSSPSTKASSFLTAGKLMQLGAVRHTAPDRPKIPNLPNLSSAPIKPLTTPTTSPLLRPMSQEDSGKLPPQQDSDEEDSTVNNTNTPQDWLEPKIYRGSTKV